MTQTRINVKRLVDNIRKTNVYTPIVEAIVNAIDSCIESNRKDGEILVTLVRSAQQTLDDELPPITSIKISDNGIGFTPSNVQAFSTIYTDNKSRKGGKGFGRFVYLKYFDSISVVSTYNNRGIFNQTSFIFTKDDNIMQNEKTEVLSEVSDTFTTVSLENLKRDSVSKLDRKIDTISRKLLEKLLVYFVLDDYSCPKIIIHDPEDKNKKIILNDYLGQGKEIIEIDKKDFTLESEDKSAREKFKVKIFKIFYGSNRSSVNLVADHRLVTEEALHTYIPEFKSDFFDKVSEKNFTIKVYVSGDYLDKNVSLERDGFEFEYNREMLHPFSRSEIENASTNVAREIFLDEIQTRQSKKEDIVKKFIDTQSPWNKTYLKDLDLSKIPYDPSEAEIDAELQKIRFAKESITRSEINSVLESEDSKEVAEKTKEIVSRITQIQANDLVHYIVLRRTILDLFKKSLKWDDTKKYEKEKVIHDIIFPVRSDSDTSTYEQHNLWVIDERLNFTEYIASDKPLVPRGNRPDIVVFDNKVSVRSGDEAANPIIVFEFKKPQRDAYAADEDPLKQITGYIKKIRNGEFTKPDGRNIYTNGNTPAFGYLICDITPKIDEFCQDFGLSKSPDNQGYFGFHPNHKIYFEVMSFDKLLTDSELRNKIFFKKLGLT